MAISKHLRLLKPCLGGIVLATGIAAIGCGMIDEPPPPEQTAEQTTEAYDATGAPMPVHEQRKNALALTHARVLQLFINQPSFGGIRMVPEYHVDADILRSPASLAKQPDRQDPRYSPPARGKDAPPHASFQKRAAALSIPPWSETEVFEPWVFRKVQLVGLVKHPEPVAYESDDVAMGATAAEIPTRSLDSFEARGLKKLREGEDLYVEAIPGKRARVLGPIFTGAKCVSCHAKTGEMLGAFSYTYDIGKIPAKPATGTPLQPVP